MQADHTFDNYFGTYPGADGIPPGTCHAAGPATRTERLRRALPPRRRAPPEDLEPHARRSSAPVQRRADGRLRRRVPAAGPRRHDGDGLLRRRRPALLLERRRPVHAVRPLLQLGRASAAGSTTSTGWPASPRPQASGCRRRATATSRPSSTGCRQRACRWKFYVRELRPGGRTSARTRRPTAAAVIRVPLLGFARFLDDPTARRAHRRPRRVLPRPRRRDASRGGVRRDAPDPARTRPAASQAGQTLVRSMIAELARAATGRARRSCGPTTAGAVGTTTCRRRRSTTTATGSGCRPSGQPVLATGRGEPHHAGLHRRPALHRGELEARAAGARGTRVARPGVGLRLHEPPRPPELSAPTARQPR